MKALRYYGRNDIRIENIPLPTISDGEVLVRVEWCGICGTDLHEYTAGPLACPPPERRHAITGEHIPVTMGHEFCGRVEASKAPSFQKGQAVMVDPRLFCSSCPPCQNATPNLCKTLGFIGLSGGGGGLAEYVVLRPESLYALPEGAPLHLAALIEPLAVAWHGIRKSGVEVAGDTPILVIGGGPIGLAVCVVLRAQGAKNICVSEPGKYRREKAAVFADVVIDPIEENISAKMFTITEGRGLKVVFDCAGVQTGLDQGMMSLGTNGVYLNLAGWTTTWQPSQGLMMIRELSLKVCLSYTEEDFSAVVDGFINNRFALLEHLVTSRILLDDVEENGFKELIADSSKQLKILVTPRLELLSV